VFVLLLLPTSDRKEQVNSFRHVTIFCCKLISSTILHGHSVNNQGNLIFVNMMEKGVAGLGTGRQLGSFGILPVKIIRSREPKNVNDPNGFLLLGRIRCNVPVM